MRISRQIAAAAIGNALEWYDFAIYGYLAVTMSNLFFPPEFGWASLLATFGLFAVAYIVRPVAGVLLGYCADRFGRRALLTFAMVLMALGSMMIAAAPSYQTVGALAPVIVFVARVLQGMSAGSEFGSATAFLIEHAPARQRGLYGAWQFAGQGVAVLLSGVIGLLVTRGLSAAQLDSWGWRLPFAFGAMVGPIGIYIRLRLLETPEFLRDRAARVRGGVLTVANLIACRRSLAVGFGLVVGGTAAFYVLFVFLPTYAIRFLRLGIEASFVAPLVAGATVAACCPIMGHLSDRLGRRWLMGSAAGIFLAILYPAFMWLAAEPTAVTVGVTEFVFGVLFAAYTGPFSALLAELFPVGVRATGMAAAYNFGVALFGGSAPFIVSWLITTTGDQIAPAYYVMAGLGLSLIALVGAPLLGSKHPSGITANAPFGRSGKD